MSDFNSESRFISNQEYDQLQSQLREKDGLLKVANNIFKNQDNQIKDKDARIDSLTKQLAKYKAALEPFINCVENRGDLRGTGEWRFSISGDAWENLRAALAEGTEGEKDA